MSQTGVAAQEVTWVYKSFEPGLWTVGFYDPDGQWEAESDHGSPGEAAGRVAWLNGSGNPLRHEQELKALAGAVSIEVTGILLSGTAPEGMSGLLSLLHNYFALAAK